MTALFLKGDTFTAPNSRRALKSPAFGLFVDRARSDVRATTCPAAPKAAMTLPRAAPLPTQGRTRHRWSAAWTGSRTRGPT
jgi:hypothetical protein